MNKIFGALTAATIASGAAAQETEQPRQLDFDISGIAVLTDSIETHGDNTTKYYELEHINGCTASFYITGRDVPIPPERKVEELKTSLINAFRRGTMEDLFQDRQFLSAISTGHFYCEEGSNSFPGKGIVKYTHSVRFFPDNGQTYQVTYKGNRLSGDSLSLINREFFKGRLPTDGIFGLVGAGEVDYQGCIKEFQNNEPIFEDCLPN